MTAAIRFYSQRPRRGAEGKTELTPKVELGVARMDDDGHISYSSDTVRELMAPMVDRVGEQKAFDYYRDWRGGYGGWSEPVDEDVEEADRADLEPEDDEAIRAAGGDQFREYWTRGEGLAKWINHPHPWTALRNHLRKHVGQARANRIASQWFKLVTGLWPGERKGDNPAGPG